MKNSPLLGALLLVIAISCDENETISLPKKSDVQFSFPLIDGSSSGGRLQATAKSILVTFEDDAGNILFDKRKLALYQFGNTYLSEVISLEIGDYQLTEFLVLDANDEIVYATPLEGAPLAYLVQNPLPLPFTILKEQTLKIISQVIAIEDYNAGDFGYNTFSFDVVKTFTFSTAAFVYQNSTENFELTSADIQISSNSTSEVLYSGELLPETNYIRIKDGHPSYTVTVSKAGYETFIQTFTTDELKAYTGSNVLTVEFIKDENRAILLDGINDYVELGNIYDNVQFPLTISSWIWVDPGETLQVPIFVSQDDPADPLYKGFYLVINAASLFTGYGDGMGGNHPYYRNDKTAGHGDVSGEWIYVAAVIRGAADMDLYINGINIGGEYVGDSNSPMDSDFPDAVAKIGTWSSNGFTYHYQGMIDEVKVWNIALTESEIQTQMTKKLSGSESGLIGYWDFDEADGTTVLDRSTNSYNGTIQGGATRVPSGIPALN